METLYLLIVHYVTNNILQIPVSCGQPHFTHQAQLGHLNISLALLDETKDRLVQHSVSSRDQSTCTGKAHKTESSFDV